MVVYPMMDGFGRSLVTRENKIINYADLNDIDEVISEDYNSNLFITSFKELDIEQSEYYFINHEYMVTYAAGKDIGRIQVNREKKIISYEDVEELDTIISNDIGIDVMIMDFVLLDSK
jgi:hypothetical protein